MNLIGPSQEGAPDGLPEPVRVPPEMIEEALRTLNMSVVEEEFRDVQANGLTFEQCMKEIDELILELDKKAAA